MSLLNKFVSGQWNALCDRCSLKFKSGQLRQEWTGLRVCKDCYETRHPQTLIRIPREDVTPDWSRPEPADLFVAVDQLTIETIVDPNNILATWLQAENGAFLLTEN